MGSGFVYKCKKCKHTYSVALGIGMMFPKVYRETIEKVRAGEYGPQWKEALDNEKYMSVNAEKNLYRCQKCGWWDVQKDMSLYAPNDPAAIPGKQYGIKTVEEWGYVPYVMLWKLQSDYHFVKSYIHKCEKCGSRMKKITKESEMLELPCPKCGTQNDEPELMDWD